MAGFQNKLCVFRLRLCTKQQRSVLPVTASRSNPPQHSLVRRLCASSPSSCVAWHAARGGSGATCVFQLRCCGLSRVPLGLCLHNSLSPRAVPAVVGGGIIRYPSPVRPTVLLPARARSFAHAPVYHVPILARGTLPKTYRIIGMHEDERAASRFHHERVRIYDPWSHCGVGHLSDRSASETVLRVNGERTQDEIHV